MSENDQIISRLAVKIECTDNTLRGSGIIWTSINDKILYVFTAAHCLFKDGDKFSVPFEKVIIKFFDEQNNSYHPIETIVNQKLLFKDTDRDVAVLIFKKQEVQNITGELPEVFAARDRYAHGDFIVKGFPSAAGGELDVLNPTWQQRLTGVHKFQLMPDKTYYASRVRGYSGSGVFIKTEGQYYLMGIFTRFREEEKGNVIYCQYLDTINEILEANFLPSIRFSYVGRLNINQDFFNERLKIALENLGPRFNEELNFKMPIARRFNDAAKDSYFRKRVYRIFDDWLTEKSNKVLKDNTHIGGVEHRLAAFKSGVIEWFIKLDFSGETAFDITWLRQEIRSIETEIHSKTMELIQQRGLLEKEEKKKHKPDDRRERLPFDDELERLREINRSNISFLRNLEYKIDFGLVNQPFLLIKGAAGEGKSHILGDIANERLKMNRPAILLLGQHFYSSKSIGENILGQLDLQCRFSEFLTVLNEIGKQVNSRVLLMIDALNESHGTELWRDHLSGFIREVAAYPYIALIFTIRSTYYDTTIPDNLKEDEDYDLNTGNTLRTITHEGFRGKEYEALSLFCKHYDLKQPTFPIISPEFTNPLFLQLVCIGVSSSGEKAFPSGFQGIKKVFNYYIDAVNNKLLLKEVYANRHGLVKKAVDLIAVTCYGKKNRLLTLDETVALFDEHFERFPNLLQDLIQENVLIRNRKYSRTGELVDTIYFAFERLGDFIIADYLINGYESAEEVMTAFSFSGEHGPLFVNYYNEGIVEALAVLLPERYNIEIFELRDGLQDPAYSQEGDGDDIWRFSGYFLKSLKWRSVQNIDMIKVGSAFESGRLEVDDNDWLMSLMEFSSVAGHPLNSDALHELLSDYSMADRDSFWQGHLEQCGYNNSYSSNTPVQRIIDWAWTPGISAAIDSETARLTGQSLAWLLASTYISLRDKASKAMVNLLVHHPESLIKIFTAFEAVEDMYIQERLYAVAYGCVLRDLSLKTAREVSVYVYERIFKQGDPPRDIMLRDYARNICEYGIKSHPDLNFNMTLVRPPYKSKMPLFPQKQDIEKFKIPYTPETDNLPHRYMFNRIYSSVIDDDFGEKVIKNAVREFSAVPINGESDLKQFKSGLSREKKKAVNGIQSCLQLITIRTKYHHRLKNLLEENLEEENLRVMKIIDSELDKLNEEEQLWMKEYGMPYMKSKEDAKVDKYIMMSSLPVKYWVVQRAFELGWDIDLHGEFDKGTGHYNNRHNNRVERIGKKYQWIAFYEILGILADNFKMDARFGRSRKQFYKGTWQLFLRDIDPAYITPNPPEMDDDEKEDDDLELSDLTEKLWWEQPDYRYWNIPSVEWAYKIEDLPSVEEVLIKKDEDETEWVHLRHYVEWREPKALGEEKYWVQSKRLVYLIQGYLIKEKDKKSILSYLEGRSFWNRWMPESGGGFSRLINRENFWSPAYADESSNPVWDTIRDTRYKIMTADIKAKGSMEDDQSGANREYHMPCRFLFEGMKLQYAEQDGNFILPDGSTAVMNPNATAPMMRRGPLQKFLKEKGMAIIWAVLGEKIADNGDHNYDFGVPCGVFSLEEDGIRGNMIMHERD
ncbi:AVAST type 2 anti-phage system protein Avs2 [Flavobacterium sp. fv08]|uniref:AVAST type 2 anti-phage system protein Avs2 n=1 Tax=Flavobacterium sp. fv08 TaxID=1761784 RepID=UPI0008C11324|nr:AVAST type 2 anti-phage system protein Avs2 [Flavobacterium sp. fv08]SEP05924.1 hypothetical protein SAMN04487978_4343 [Flavobacterium sp. fv08]